MPPPWKKDPLWGKPERRQRERELRQKQLEAAVSDQEYIEYRYSRDRSRVRVLLGRVAATLRLVGRRVWRRVAS